MDHQRNQPKQGQAIVIMAFAIIALAALVGLAIDGGNLYTLRRRAQIGADSTAMAGTQMLADLISRCAAPTTAHDTAIRDQILEYARRNGIDEFSPNGDVTAWYVNKDRTNLGFVGAGVPIPTGATGISTRLVTTDTTTFMRLFGFRHVVAPGEATAMAGDVLQVGGGGLLPIAVPEKVVRTLGPNQPFSILNTGDFKDFCSNNPEICEGDVDAAAQRGWLQLAHIYNNDPNIMARGFSKTTETSGSCSDTLDKAGLRRWLIPECPYPHSVYAGQLGMSNGDFILGVTGTKSPGLHDIQSYWLGKVGYMPVFDLIYSGTDQKADPRMNTIFPSPAIPKPVNTWVDGASTYYYHIVGFVAVTLNSVDGHTLNGNFVSATIQAGQLNIGNGIGAGTCRPGLVGISLVD
jgi:hypothetical protein